MSFPIESFVEIQPENVEGYIVGSLEQEDGTYRYSVATYGIYGYMDNVSEERITLIGLPTESV